MKLDPPRWTDAELLEAIQHHEDRIRRSRDRLAIHNAEWARRHTIGPCARDCREPHARDGSYAR